MCVCSICQISKLAICLFTLTLSKQSLLHHLRFCEFVLLFTQNQRLGKLASPPSARPCYNWDRLVPGLGLPPAWVMGTGWWPRVQGRQQWGGALASGVTVELSRPSGHQGRAPAHCQRLTESHRTLPGGGRPRRPAPGWQQACSRKLLLALTPRGGLAPWFIHAGKVG